MSIDATGQRTIAAVFDLRLSASREALRKVIGMENVPQFEASNQPLVVLIIEAPHGKLARLAFEDEARLLEFYRTTLRANTKLEPQDRVQFVLRDVAPTLEDSVRQATQVLAREFGGS
jgi:hypothetical protein